MDRNATIATIRAALKRRSGKPWSVTGGRGTAWGWLTISAPPARCTWSHRPRVGFTEEYDTGEPGHHMSPADRADLGALLGLDGPVHIAGESIPAGHDYWREYIDRAEGRTPAVCGRQYWD